MTDILMPLLFLAIYYLGTALLKFLQKKQSLPPEIPEQQPLEAADSFAPAKKTPPYLKRTADMQATLTPDKNENMSEVKDEASAWQGKLNENMLVNGVIFAEILQAPRAYRPMVRRNK